MSDAQNVDEKIKAFYERMTERLAELQAAPVAPEALKSLIKKEDLIHIYQTMLSDEKFKKYVTNRLTQHKSARWSKRNSPLARTINIIFDPVTDDICLMLETKSKVIDASGETIKDITHTPKFSGSFKTAKPAWRIDTQAPIKYANAVFYAKEKSQLQGAATEAAIPKRIAKKSQRNTFLNQTAIGMEINKPGIRSSNQKPYESKQSFYSKWANGGDLFDFLQSVHAQELDTKQLNEMARELLTAVESMHDEQNIHQDIKLENILVFIDKNGHYHLELADFGYTYDPKDAQINSAVNATVSYESPEISAVSFYHSKDPAFAYDYFFKPSVDSYGRDIFLRSKTFYLDKVQAQTEKYARPAKENDMWALGVVLYQLYSKKTVMPTESDSTHFSALIKGLLNPNRVKRFTAKHALTQLSSQAQLTEKPTRLAPK